MEKIKRLCTITKMYPVFLLPGDVPEEGNKSEIDLINKKHMTEDFFLLKSCAFLQ